MFADYKGNIQIYIIKFELVTAKYIIVLRENNKVEIHNIEGGLYE